MTPIVIPISTGASAPVSRSDVNFYDYDGTLLYAYTIAQANALAALPAAPTHTGLTFQEWNYTLAQINATTRAIDVGATYITDDGKTRLYIHIASTLRAAVPLYWSQTVANGVTVDWGDGSNSATFSGTGNLNTSHTYSAVGDYVITLYPASGCTLGLGNSSNTSVVVGGTYQLYRNMLSKIEIGLRVSSIDAYSFYHCYNIRTITISNSVTRTYSAICSGCYKLQALIIPRSVTTLGDNGIVECINIHCVSLPISISSIPDYTFTNCYTLQNISLPDSITSLGAFTFLQNYVLNATLLPSTITSLPGSCFSSCYTLASIIIPSGVTSIGANAFYNCYGLSLLIIPGAVTGIGNNAFYGCDKMKEYHFLSTTPPTLASNTVFYSIPSDCVIYVPAASVDAYKAATYWSAQSSKIVGE